MIAMQKGWVQYEWRGLPYIAMVKAPLLPEQRTFGTYQDLNSAMDKIGNLWELTCETPHPHEYAFDDVQVWEKQISESIAVELAEQKFRGKFGTKFLPGFSR